MISHLSVQRSWSERDCSALSERAVTYRASGTTNHHLNNQNSTNQTHVKENHLSKPTMKNTENEKKEGDVSPSAVQQRTMDGTSAQVPYQQSSPETSNGTFHGAINSCCKGLDKRLQHLQTENGEMKIEISALNRKLAEKDSELDTKVSELIKSNKSSTAMKNLLSQQKKLGDQCKLEMETLAKTFEEKSRNFKYNSEELLAKNDNLREENQELREEISRLRADLEDKTVEAFEAKEMNGIYSAKLTKLERKFKKFRNEEEESYMELTF